MSNITPELRAAIERLASEMYPEEWQKYGERCDAIYAMEKLCEILEKKYLCFNAITTDLINKYLDNGKES